MIILYRIGDSERCILGQQFIDPSYWLIEIVVINKRGPNIDLLC